MDHFNIRKEMFKLNIECSKDIDKLSIDFSDGSSSFITKRKNQKSNKDEKINLDTEFGELSKEIIQKPKIQDKIRSTKIAHELQNLNL